MVAKPESKIRAHQEADQILDEIGDIQAYNSQEASKELKALLKAMRDRSKHVDFPVDAFPAPMQYILKAFHDAFKYPVDYYGMAMMVGAGAVIGNAYVARYDYKWEAPPLMWGVIIGPSGMAKSKTMKAMLGPHYKIQDKYNEQYVTSQDIYQANIRRVKDGSMMEEEVGEEPRRQKIILKKSTMEALQQMLATNPRGCMIVRDELSGWIKSMNQYRAGDDQETFLEIWDNEDIHVDTVNRQIYIKKAFVNVLGGIQPGIIESLAADDRAANGFLARILFAYPQSMHKPYPSKNLPDPQIYDEYDRIISNLHALPVIYKDRINKYDTYEVEPIPLLLNKEARELYYKFLCDSTDQQNDTDDELTKAILAKMDTYCLRFCCLLALLDLACEHTQVNGVEDMKQYKIKPETVLNAIKLVNYFKYTAERVCVKLESPLKRESEELQTLYQVLPEEFSTKDIVETGEKSNISKRTIERFLGNKELFKRLGKGRYEKKY